ncbi:hypothetical protein FHS57_001526 [Runella defluvii]|uniref:Uncharacterized protein n=1 Tax=Runella defluvii TaxID=370973 RepID=A0A7W5ZHR9_9BACT|nr:hypothetical protein [Runella defluvii]
MVRRTKNVCSRKQKSHKKHKWFGEPKTFVENNNHTKNHKWFGEPKTFVENNNHTKNHKWFGEPKTFVEPKRL